MRLTGKVDKVTDMTLAAACADDALICTYVQDQTGSDFWAEVSTYAVGIPLTIIGFLLAAWVLRWLAHRLIDRVVKRAMARKPSGRSSGRRDKRVEAMAGLIGSIVTGVIFAIVGTMMLAQLGVNIAPIIASAGLLGIALGFGAQSLVRDFLSGVFMILEDQFGPGDIIDVGEAVGTVEEVNLRHTRIRDIHGTVWYMPNGEILRVGNLSQNWSRTVLDIGIAYSESIARTREILQELAGELFRDEQFAGEILEEPEVWGVQELAADSVTIRVVLKTTPGSQWVVAREMRQRVKDRFDLEGIEIPFPQRVVWTRAEQAEEKDPDSSAEAAQEAEENKGQSSDAEETGSQDPEGTEDPAEGMRQ